MRAFQLKGRKTGVDIDCCLKHLSFGKGDRIDYMIGFGIV